MAPKKKPAEKPEGSLRFEDLELSELTLEALRVAGYEEPTAIQAGMIPKAIDGIDLVGQARTGTGKTAAFAIPIIEVLESRDGKSPRALILVPTRELAVQVRGEVVKLSHGRRLNCVAVYGGMPIREQIEKLRRGADIIVGTPGRVMDHMSRRTLELTDLEIVVLDEADRMLDIGFRPDIEKILRQCPADRQTLLLSATVPPPIERMAQAVHVRTGDLEFLPHRHLRRDDRAVLFHGGARPQIRTARAAAGPRKTSPGHRLLPHQAAHRIALSPLSKHVDNPACIHGDMAQSSRDRVMERFRAGKIRCLIATDVVGRGIDVTSISHIINFDTPQFCDDYVHRVGRTGRMGREGVAFTFVAPEEGPELTRIEQRINRQLKRDELSGFDATPNETPLAGHADLSDETPEATATGPSAGPPPPPPFGRRGRRHRRAL